ncbi:MAG: 30S ribosomal protein S17 [Eubacteriales bacterium]|nr:30S ribosomal protein S17 [Eubacteriales bacterium]
MATNEKSTAVKATAKVTKAAPAAKTTKAPAEVKKVATKAPKAKAVKKADATRVNRRKVLRGVVISNKMEKTGVVEITRKVPHPLYKKVVTKTSRFKFHDENNECSIGDTIEVMETRPLSKDKYFRLVRIVEKVK